MHLCKRIDRVEWSGYIFYREHGNLITDPENFWIECYEAFPMKKESPGGVEQEPDGNVTKHFREQYLQKGKTPPVYGTVHSHHNMGVFFSGTDYADLEKNAKVHNYYLSVVVDNAGRVLGRIGSVVEREMKGKESSFVRDGSGKKHYLTEKVPATYSTKKELVEYRCRMEIEGGATLPDWFLSRTLEIIKEAAPGIQFTPAGNGQHGHRRPAGQQAIPFLEEEVIEGYTRNEVESFLAKWVMGTDEWIGGLTQALAQAEKAIVSSQAPVEVIHDQFEEEMINGFDIAYLGHFNATDDEKVMQDVLIQSKAALKSYGDKRFVNIIEITRKAIKFLKKNDFVTEGS